MNVSDIDTVATDRGISTDLELATCVDTGDRMDNTSIGTRRIVLEEVRPHESRHCIWRTVSRL